MKFLFVLIVFVNLITSFSKTVSQDLLEHVHSPVCGTNNSSLFCNNYSTYFPMSNDTLKALIIFANYPDGNWDPININSNLIYMQYWPGATATQKPSWADSVICPTTTNVWHPSLTGLLAQSSNGKFWLIGDVYPDIVILNNNTDYYSPSNGRRIGTAIKEIIDEVNPNVNFANYDKFDPCDFDSDGNRREPDGTVDFIFIIFRFNGSSVTDPDSEGNGYTGIADLGGQSRTFGTSSDSALIWRDGKKISAAYPGSGCIAEMYFKWYIGVPEHEFTQHYGYGGYHLDGLGSHSVNGGGIASAYDREHFSWTFGNIYQPTSNTTDINLRDYSTTGDYIKVVRNQKTYFVENRRRLNYYSSNNIHSWRWTVNEPLLPMQRDSGLFIYDSNFNLHHAYGRWDFATCAGNPIRWKILKPPYINQYIPETVNRFNGMTMMNLKQKVATINCGTVTNQYTGGTVDKASYIGEVGDSKTCFDVNYNQVFSPWSNPGVPISSSSDSLTIELVERNSDGSIDVNVYFTNMPLASPSKPQFLKTSKQYNSSPQGSFYVRLKWLRNKEPDMYTYGIYKATTNTPGVDATYSYLGSTSDTTYLDNSILMYDPNTRYPGTCPPLPVTFSYRITAVDLTDKESVRSDRDSISGYYDPCDEQGADSQLGENHNPTKNELLQNYPNPFNPITKIKYYSKDQGNVNISVYDITGKNVVTIIDGHKMPGVYDIDFDATKYNLSSGIYFYKIQINNFSEIRTMILLK